MKVGLKPGTSLIGVSAEMSFAFGIIAGVFDDHGVPLIVTAVTDGKHGNNSLHYRGRAVDIRLPSRYCHDDKVDAAILFDLRECLGAQFDCVLETDHIHIEFDPKPQPVV